VVIESLFYKIRKPYRITIYDLEGSVIYSGVKNKITSKIYNTIKYNIVCNISKVFDTFEREFLKIVIDSNNKDKPISVSISFNDLKYILHDEIIEIIENDNTLYYGNIDNISYEDYKNYIVYSIILYKSEIKIIIKYVGVYNNP